MLFHLLLLILGFVALYYGAEWMVRGSSQLAKITGIRPVIIGLTIVAFGTSAPELVVSINSAAYGTTSIATGNIIGSMIANMGLILGLSAIFSPIIIRFELLKKELPFLLISEGIFFLLFLNLQLSRIEGGILFSIFIIFNCFYIREAIRGTKDKEVIKEYEEYLETKKDSKIFNLFLIIIGVLSLAGGSHFVVSSTMKLGTSLGISHFILSASVVAFGTSLPELATSIIAVLKKEYDISIGNILGSNIFNILLCLGLAAIINPLIIEKSTLFIDMVVMIIMSILMGIFMWTQKKITRFEGILLLIIYVGYIIYLFN